MKNDVVIIGSELDAFVAALKLNELGYNSRIIAAGKGSQLYSLGNIKILSLLSKDNELNASPYDFIDQLNDLHPYKKIGKKNVENSINWFLKYINNIKFEYSYGNKNTNIVSAIGNKIPSYALYPNQLNFDDVKNSKISIVHFKNQRDFHSQLIADSISKYVIKSEIIHLDPPDKDQHLDSSSLAQSFDRIYDNYEYFKSIEKKIDPESEIVIFPAVLGLNKFSEIIFNIEKILAKKCFEAPTLPPSIPSMRLNKLLEKEILKFTNIHKGANIVKADVIDGKCLSLIDNFGRIIKGNYFIFANGGILMGGLTVKSDGKIYENILNCKVHQINPMTCKESHQTIEALQTSGVITNNNLNPLSLDSKSLNNVFFTGRNLSHWNPSTEFSSEGVSIASGWSSANNIARLLN